MPEEILVSPEDFAQKAAQYIHEYVLNGLRQTENPSSVLPTGAAFVAIFRKAMEHACSVGIVLAAGVAVRWTKPRPSTTEIYAATLNPYSKPHA